MYQNKWVYMFFNLYIYRMFENSRQTKNSKKFYDNISHAVSSKYPNLENQSYPSLELIPNKLKISSWPRSMSIHKFSTARRVTLRDFASYHPKNKIPVRCQIHTTATPIKIRTNRKDHEILANTSHTMIINRQNGNFSHDQYFLNTLISISNVPCTIAIEFFYKEAFTPFHLLPSKPIKAESPAPISAMIHNVSFIRNKMSAEEIRRNIIFLDIKIAMDDDYQPHPTCVVILNHLGDAIYSKRITPRKRIREYFHQKSLVSDEILRGQMDEQEAILEIYKYWRNKIIIGHDLKEKLESIQVRIDEVLGIRDIQGSKAVVERTTTADRNWSEVNKLESIYYQILGKTMRKGRIHDDVRAIKEIYDELQRNWSDHYNPTEVKEKIKLPDNTKNKDLLRWVDDQKLDEEIVIEDVRAQRKWKLIPLDEQPKDRNMASKMSYDYMRNSFRETGIRFNFSNKPDQQKDIWIDKIIDDLQMDLEDEDRRSVILTETPPSPMSINTTMEGILSNMMNLDVDGITNLISQDFITNLPIEEDIQRDPLAIPSLKIKLNQNKEYEAENPPLKGRKRVKEQTIKYGGVICNMTFSRDPDYKKRLKKSLAPTKPLTYKMLNNLNPELPPKPPTPMLSPILTPSPKNKNSVQDSQWSVDFDASFVDAGSHLLWPPK